MTIKRITRAQPLTADEAAKYDAIRQQVAAELPDLVARHHEQSAARQHRNEIPTMPTIADILHDLEHFAPLSLAASWDNVGLLLGERGVAVQRIMTCLTVTPESAAEAVEGGVQLIVTHHPILFRGVKRLTDATSEGRMLLSLARAGVAVYSPHTAFDNTLGGINDRLAGLLGLVDVQPLRRREAARQWKLVAFVPDKDLQKVSDALFAAGAGKIGEYSECAFRTAGTGTFFGSDASNPTVGQKGRREQADEWRLEVVCPDGHVDAIVAALRKAHSYEEPAYDIYPLRPSWAKDGEGRLGSLPETVPLANLALVLRTALKWGPIQLIGDPNKAIRRVAIVCGAGGEMLTDTLRGRADLFLTGEMRFHDYLTAQAEGLALMLPGHYATERLGIEALAERLKVKWPALEVWASRRESDPVSWI